MALQVSKIKPLEPHVLNIKQLWRMVDNDPLLKQHFYPLHPILDFELIDCSESLNFWVGLKQKGYKTHRVCGSAFTHDFRGVYTDSQTEAGFRISFYNVIRNLLVNVWHEDTLADRYAIKFFENGELNPNRITDFVKLCTKNFGFAKLQAVELGNAWRWFWSVDGVQDFGFHVPKDYTKIVMESDFSSAPDKCTRDHITSQIVRAFVATRSSDDLSLRAADTAKHSEKTAAIMADLRQTAAIETAVKVDQVRANQEKPLSALSIMLPAGGTISHATIAGRMGQ